MKSRRAGPDAAGVSTEEGARRKQQWPPVQRQAAGPHRLLKRVPCWTDHSRVGLPDCRLGPPQRLGTSWLFTVCGNVLAIGASGARQKKGGHPDAATEHGYVQNRPVWAWAQAGRVGAWARCTGRTEGLRRRGATGAAAAAGHVREKKACDCCFWVRRGVFFAPRAPHGGAAGSGFCGKTRFSRLQRVRAVEEQE